MGVKTIAFVPVRGGSKSIPLKNIKEFCGKPLVYWTLEALQLTASVDEIILATDSEQIEKTVVSFGFNKVSIFHRSQENASDTASTESVMLEYLQASTLHPKDVFMLVQATSPLTQSCHFEDAIQAYFQGENTSMLSCVRSFRFFWNPDGTSKNYDYQHRPRRQDFAGELMENGAFYINTVGNVLASKNRLSGKIGIYEMPEYTATEIDEPDDWMVLEKLMHKHVLSKRSIQSVKLFLSDVDGVLTDGGMYYAENGVESKKFNTRDGMGFQLLREAGIKTGIITSENTTIVANRATKLKIDYLSQGEKFGGKLNAALEICKQENLSLAEVAYIGDDINCFELLSKVGFAACPADAVDKIKSVPGIKVLSKNGGEGVVREFIELLLSSTY